MDSADSFLNWGFRPVMMKGGEYFIISCSVLNSDEWPYDIIENNHIFSKEEFVKFMGIGEGDITDDTLNYAKMIGLSNYMARHLHWRAVKGACQTYRDMDMVWDHEEGLEDIIKWTNELDLEEWAETGDVFALVQNRNWRHQDDGDDSVYKIHSNISKNRISLSLGEQPAWGDPPWAMEYVIKRVEI